MITTILAKQCVDPAVRPGEKHELGTFAIQRKRCRFETLKNLFFYTTSNERMTHYNKMPDGR